MSITRATVEYQQTNVSAVVVGFVVVVVVVVNLIPTRNNQTSNKQQSRHDLHYMTKSVLVAQSEKLPG
jgi:glucose uptake protein GlcU